MYLIFFTGSVTILAPPKPVEYNSNQNITCLAQNLGTAKWSLKSDAVYKIEDGTETEITSEPEKAILRLLKVTERWKGIFVCPAFTL